MRGTEAAGGVVMAVREAGLNPFPFLFRMKEKNQFGNFLFASGQPAFIHFKQYLFFFLTSSLSLLVSVFLCHSKAEGNFTSHPSNSKKIHIQIAETFSF